MTIVFAKDFSSKSHIGYTYMETYMYIFIIRQLRRLFKFMENLMSTPRVTACMELGLLIELKRLKAKVFKIGEALHYVSDGTTGHYEAVGKTRGYFIVSRKANDSMALVVPHLEESSLYQLFIKLNFGRVESNYYGLKEVFTTVPRTCYLGGNERCALDIIAKKHFSYRTVIGNSPNDNSTVLSLIADNGSYIRVLSMSGFTTLQRHCSTDVAIGRAVEFLDRGISGVFDIANPDFCFYALQYKGGIVGYRLYTNDKLYDISARDFRSLKAVKENSNGASLSCLTGTLQLHNHYGKLVTAGEVHLGCPVRTSTSKRKWSALVRKYSLFN